MPAAPKGARFKLGYVFLSARFRQLHRILHPYDALPVVVCDLLQPKGTRKRLAWQFTRDRVLGSLAHLPPCILNALSFRLAVCFGMEVHPAFVSWFVLLSHNAVHSREGVFPDAGHL
jgi:hypothetical protein